MPRGELDEYLDQLPEMVEILSGGAIKMESADLDQE